MKVVKPLIWPILFSDPTEGMHAHAHTPAHTHTRMIIPVEHRSLTHWDHTNGRLVGVTCNLLTCMTLNSWDSQATPSYHPCICQGHKLV